MSDLIFQFQPTGKLYPSENYNKHPFYKLFLKQKGNLLFQSQPTEVKEFKPSGGWEESNEPEFHLNDVAEKISSFGNIKSILCFSYKDKTLAFRINQKNPAIIDCLFDKELGLIGKFPEDFSEEYINQKLSNYLDQYDLIIFRHYLEHFKSPKFLIKSIKKCLKEKGLMYIEVPDCSKFITQGNPLFLWEQHLYYFTKESIWKIIKDSGVQACKIYKYGKDIEPSICCFCFNDYEKSNQMIDYCRIDNRKSELNKKINFSKYIDSWKKFFQLSNRKKIILGIGHNADRFMQITDAYKYIDYIVDDDIDKQGKFLNNFDKPITSLNMIRNLKNYDFILAIHDRSFFSASEKLSYKYGVKNFFSIFKIPENYV